MIKEWQPLAEKGDLQAQVGMGELYLRGDGVKEDPRAAADWFKRAADKGFADGQYALAVLLRDGTGVRRDLRACAELFLKASLQKHSGAQFALARLYELGQGVDQDDAKALAWYMLSRDNGNPFADERAIRLSLEMSTEKIAAGEKLAKEIPTKGAKL
ncbi:MAG: sel1 repeat family protein [Alphaproteobacteria bacterium]|nr:sel1 repeat family protein [Alphaproteobacteria bacterium]